jgi:hypothetical protein
MQPRKPSFGDYLVGALQAATPMVLSGFQSKMYAKCQDTAFKAYNSYLDVSATAYTNYVSHMTTLGIPAETFANGARLNSCGNSGGFFGGGGMGYPFMGNAGGGFNNGNMLGLPMGNQWGGAFNSNPYGYSPFSNNLGGMPWGSGYPYMNGQFGANNPWGSPYGNGTSPWGGSGIFGNGGVNGQWGNYNNGGWNGAGLGYDPSYLLNQQRMQMQWQNSMIAQQQMMEAYSNYQQSMMYSYNPYASMGMYNNPSFGVNVNFGWNNGYQQYPFTATPPYFPYSSSNSNGTPVGFPGTLSNGQNTNGIF